MAAVPFREYSFTFRDLELAVAEYGAPDGPPVLALHGWQDNAASFAVLAELLPGLRWIAPDLPGHGRSDWRHPQASYSTWHYLEEMQALLDHLQLPQVILVGHSMGGGVAALLAAALPERCSRLVLLDSVGPLATAPENALQQLQEFLSQLDKASLSRRRRHADLEAAVAARCARGLSVEAARLLAERGVATDGKGVFWRLDPRLSLRNPLSLTEEHARAMLGAIACPVLLIAATSNWTRMRDWFELRLPYFRQLQWLELGGSHHQHMEGEAAQVARLIADFLGVDAP